VVLDPRGTQLCVSKMAPLFNMRAPIVFFFFPFVEVGRSRPQGPGVPLPAFAPIPASAAYRPPPPEQVRSIGVGVFFFLSPSSLEIFSTSYRCSPAIDS